MTKYSIVFGNLASILSVIWHKGVRCPIGSGMTEEKEVRGTISSLPGAIVIAGLTGNLEMPDRGRA